MMKIEELYRLFTQSEGVTTDSRAVRPGCIFFALKGNNFDGNDFAAASVEKGASWSVADRAGVAGEKIILVENALSTLQQLARYHREQLGIPLFALTGTNGKTTTKELVSAVLSAKYKVASTAGNLNNHIGVPLTLLKMDSTTEMAVVEMGASGPGEIRDLCEIARPDMGLITNVGKAHLLGFGSFEGVKKTKGELYDFLEQNGSTALYNIDNPNLCGMIAQRDKLRKVAYGLNYSGARILPASPEEPFLRIALEDGKVVNTQLVGSYNAENVMAALAAAELTGTERNLAIAAIENYKPSNNRSQMVKGKDNLLIVDAYNANPTSMRAALENFRQMEAANKVVIMGDMLELGADSQKEHKEILDIARGINIRYFFFVGSEFRSAAAGDEFYNTRGNFFEDSLRLKEFLEENPLRGNTILIKGSRGTKLEKALEILS